MKTEIYTDDTYVYATFIYGLNVIDIASETKGAYIESYNNFTSVCGNTSTVFLGTTSSGVKYIDKNDVTIDLVTPVDLSSYVQEFKRYPYLTSDTVTHLHVRDNNVLCCTVSGVDFFKLDPNGYRSSTTCSGAYKCFLPPNDNIYYLTSSGSKYLINKVNTNLMDWTAPDEIFTVDEGLVIHDLFVTVGTATDKDKNTLFIATSSGIYIIDESTYEADVYYAME